MSILEWRSQACKRAFGAETMSAVEGLEAAQYLRSLLATLVTGKLAKHNDALNFCPVLALTDCKSLHDYLHRAGQPRLPSDRRLAIDLAALRQDLRAEVPEGARVQAAIPLRWIPTTMQMADILTKPKKGDDWWAAWEEGIQNPKRLHICGAFHCAHGLGIPEALPKYWSGPAGSSPRPAAPEQIGPKLCPPGVVSVICWPAAVTPTLDLVRSGRIPGALGAMGDWVIITEETFQEREKSGSMGLHSTNFKALPHIEADLSRQLASLGLAALINAPAGPKRNRQKLQAKLERARDLKQREEQVLQQTIALLQQCLREPSGIEDDREMPPPPPPCPPVPPAAASDERPKMSPRSSFRRGDMRRERDDSEHLRFNEQTAPIPSSNQRHRSTSTGSEAPEGPNRRPQRRGRSRARTEEVRPTNQADISSVSWMLEYDHVQPENLANPFQQCRQSVVHSSNLRHRPIPSNEPQPPPFHYGEPTPPMDVPPAAASARSWRTADGPWRAGYPRLRRPARAMLSNALLLNGNLR
ncbi:hypothetical protein AK812_SmicGene23313 [Symbiodinium microadriaticum]|uniref:Uncharacterized protein n=1 Tax=Symbiodinium microadriaticum TaxID=2951 RepID=A0A1Q9DHJ2_SYMMI|nr:hypothetical protein AK812_SmicGene23313 [Symbiodinium microadriaticum]